MDPLRPVHDLYAAFVETSTDAPASCAALVGRGRSKFPSRRSLVTIPAMKDVPDWFHTCADYRQAGDRAIVWIWWNALPTYRAGQRGGFEATADMLSITGLTLEQFANLMEGLGYAAEKGERPKVKAAPVVEVAKRLTRLKQTQKKAHRLMPSRLR